MADSILKKIGNVLGSAMVSMKEEITTKLDSVDTKFNPLIGKTDFLMDSVQGTYQIDEQTGNTVLVNEGILSKLEKIPTRFDSLSTTQKQEIASYVTIPSIDLSAILNRLQVLEDKLANTTPIAQYLFPKPFINTRDNLVLDTTNNTVTTNFSMGLYSSELIDVVNNMYVSNIFATEFSYENIDMLHLSYDLKIFDGRTELPNGNFISISGYSQIDNTGSLLNSYFNAFDLYKDGANIDSIPNDMLNATEFVSFKADYGTVAFVIRPPVDINQYLNMVGLDLKDLFYKLDINLYATGADTTQFEYFITGGTDRVWISNSINFGELPTTQTQIIYDPNTPSTGTVSFTASDLAHDYAPALITMSASYNLINASTRLFRTNLTTDVKDYIITLYIGKTDSWDAIDSYKISMILNIDTYDLVVNYYYYDVDAIEHKLDVADVYDFLRVEPFILNGHLFILESMDMVIPTMTDMTTITWAINAYIQKPLTTLDSAYIPEYIEMDPTPYLNQWGYFDFPNFETLLATNGIVITAPVITPKITSIVGNVFTISGQKYIYEKLSETSFKLRAIRTGQLVDYSLLYTNLNIAFTDIENISYKTIKSFDNIIYDNDLNVPYPNSNISWIQTEYTLNTTSVAPIPLNDSVYTGFEYYNSSTLNTYTTSTLPVYETVRVFVGATPEGFIIGNNRDVNYTNYISDIIVNLKPNHTADLNNFNITGYAKYNTWGPENTILSFTLNPDDYYTQFADTFTSNYSYLTGINQFKA